MPKLATERLVLLVPSSEDAERVATEALAAVIRYAFDDLRLHRLMANYMPRNARSARLLEKLGFREEGRARDYLLIEGTWQDHVLTSLVNPRWTPA